MHNNRLEKLLEFIEKEPNDPFLKYALATEYVRINQPETALTYYQDLIDQHRNYVGTYYHLGKLYEVLDKKEQAIETYRTGMLVAREVRDNHAFSELQAVYNSAIGEDYEDD